MNRPELQSISITPNPVQTKKSISVLIDVLDIEIVFGTALNYARTGDIEIYAGEGGII